MTDPELFGKTFQCECGRTHSIQPREAVYADDVLQRLPDVCARATDGRKVAVLMDVRTRAAAGAEVAAALAQAGWQVNELLVPDPASGKSPICDDVTHDALGRRLGQPDLILPVGAGVIGDLGKWFAQDGSLPYVPFATAASMNGYASSNIAPTLRGVKRLVYGHAPAAVLSAPAVLRDAPYELTASGLGDILAKSTSSPDWYLNHRLFGDYYCPRAVGLLADVEPLYLDHPQDLLARRPETVEALFMALLLAGVGMTMAETSFPASGGEHLIGHSLDMMASVDGAEHDLHGRQVGIGTILACEVYRRVLAVESPSFVEPAGKVDEPFWGPLAGVVAEQYDQKLDRLRAAPEIISRGHTWDRLRQELSAMVRPPERIRDCLAQAGAACRAEDINCDRPRLAQALRHAHEMRPRFTVLDLARLLGILPAATDDIVQTWA